MILGSFGSFSTHPKIHVRFRILLPFSESYAVRALYFNSANSNLQTEIVQNHRDSQQNDIFKMFGVLMFYRGHHKNQE